MKKNFVLTLVLIFLGSFSLGPLTNWLNAEEHKHEHGEDHDEKGESHEDHGDGDEDHDEGVIKLNKDAQDMVKLKTEPVKKMMMEKRLKVFGKIAKDTDEHSYVTADEGIIEKIHVELGAAVEKGDKLLTIRKSDGTLQEIAADIAGVIFAVYVKLGEHADRLKSLMSIVNLDKLRVTVDVYEKDIGFVTIGQKAEIQSIAFPEKNFLGEVVYISPQVEEESQAIKVRIDVDNSEHLLRLGMFISGELIAQSEQETIAVPLTAIQELNEEKIVFVKTSEDQFALTDVKLGQSLSDHVEVQDGLQEGQEVVTQGSFYLKSEKAKESFGHGHSH